MIGRMAGSASLLADGLIFAVLAEFIAAGYDGPNPEAIPAWAFCLVVLVGYGLPRLFEGFEVDATKGSVVAGAIGIVFVYFIVRFTVHDSIAIWDLRWMSDFMQDAQGTAEVGGHAIMGSMLLLGAWIRGTMRSGDEIEMESIPRSVAIPFGIVTTLVVLGAATDRSGEVARAGAAFYVMAIMSLVFSQLALSGATFGEVRAGSTAGIILLGTAGTAVVSLIVIGLFTTVLAPIVGPVLGRSVEVVLTIVLTPFAWVLTRVFEWLFAGANPFPELPEQVIRTSEEAGDPNQEERSPAGQAGLFLMRTLALFVFIGVAMLLATIFVRLRRRRNARPLDDRETIGIGSLREDFGSMFKSLFSRKRGREPGYATTEATRLYLEVLHKAEAAGHQRPAGRTAHEFAPELHETFATPVTDDITAAFEAARYAGREPDARAVAEMRERWQREAP